MVVLVVQYRAQTSVQAKERLRSQIHFLDMREDLVGHRKPDTIWSKEEIPIEYHLSLDPLLRQLGRPEFRLEYIIGR
jgi:hypothetical protein